MSEFILQVPYGTHDVLPGEATARHLLADKIYRLFSAWGYDEVETPSFEYLETFMETGQSNAGAFNLFDRAGRALILRTDMTTPLAMLMYGKEASNRKQEIDRQHYTIPNQRPKDKHCGKI